MHSKFQPEADPPMAEIQNTKYPPASSREASRAGKIPNTKKGFSLIELLVAMFIFIMVMGAMVAVSVAGFRSYIKSKAIKAVTEDVGFAFNSIAKDVRMGKIDSPDSNTSPPSPPSKQLIVTRNSTQEKVCYKISGDGRSLGVCDETCTTCNSLVDLSSAEMIFDNTSGFRNQTTDTISATKIRGWVEINLNIENPSMETDSIRVQTIVSSRDYGWDKL